MSGVTVYFITYSRFLTPFTSMDWGPIRDEHHENCKPREPEWGDTDLIAVFGEEIHNQYPISFTPPHADAEEFHRIRVTVRNRPDAVVRTRAGYWPVR
jgi:hypothetical protein